MRDLPADLRAGCRRAQQIGVMLVISVGLYAYLLGMIATQRAPFTGFAPSIDLRLLRVLFAVLAVAELVVLKIITPRLLAGPGVGWPAARGASILMARLLTLSIVRLAICEAIAIFGVVLFFLGGRWPDFYGFAVASLAASAVYFPRLSQWEDWARQAPA